ncbi:MAG: murein biosynthesis integral membrane protein MurJ, partial [Acidimicrobiia bacterium]
MTRAAAVMGAATAISRVLGFGRVLVIAAVLGTTDLGNTFSASNSVSNVAFDLLAAGALSAVLVPAFV